MYKASQQLGVSLPSECGLVPHVFKLQMGCLKNAFIEVQPPPHPKPKWTCTTTEAFTKPPILALTFEIFQNSTDKNKQTLKSILEATILTLVPCFSILQSKYTPITAFK